MIDFNQQIGHFLISPSLGIGEIVEIKEISNSGLFYSVSFPKSSSSNFFAVTSNNYRLLATKNKLEEAITIFKEKSPHKIFPSIKEKIVYYQKTLKSNDVLIMAKALSEINHESGVHVTIKKAFESALDSFLQEIEFVFKFNHSEAQNLLGLQIDG